MTPDGPIENFGWPCYEGAVRNASYDVLDLDVCEDLYADGSATTGPYSFYCHGAAPATPTSSCGSDSAGDISGLAFYPGGSYPDRYDGALSSPTTPARPSGRCSRGPTAHPTPARSRPSPGTSAPPSTCGQGPAATTWAVGERIGFSGGAVDAGGEPLPAEALSWALDLRHCYSETDCHRHRLEEVAGVTSGSMTAPDHEYPARLELVLTATEESGATGSTALTLLPRTVDLTFETSHPGLELTAGSRTAPAPFTVRAIVGSSLVVTAPTRPRRADGTTWEFVSWSDGGTRSHTIVAGTGPTTLTATYRSTTK